MAIKNGSKSISGSGVIFPAVEKGKPVKIGTFTTNGDQLQFALAPYSVEHCGSIIVQVVANGSVTTLTADIQLSLDGGVTFTAQTAAGTATVASNTSALNFQTGPLQSIAIPGVGGELSLQFVVKSLTFNTATAADVWVLAG